MKSWLAIMSVKHAHKKTYYNDIALRLAHKLLGLEHLHYGFFSSGAKADLSSLPKAQDAYVKNLISYIPKDVKKIFDVGCGTGGVAKELVKKRYTLTCLAPDPYLIEKTRENTGNRVETITDLYENVHDLPEKSFDMILMSESCQYVDMDKGWAQSARYLREGGSVLIADFFRIRELDRPGLSKSGHPLEIFIEKAKQSGFKLVKKSDITANVAPTMDIYQSLITDKIFPVFESLFEFIRRRYPLLYSTLRLLAGKKVAALRVKYSNQNAEIFRRYKGYYVLLFKKV
jgi:SAM-dependent methyltransferase